MKINGIYFSVKTWACELKKVEDPDLTSSHRRNRATATSGAAGSEPYPDTGKADFAHPECEERPH